MVTLTELLPDIRPLAFVDKLRLIRFLAEEVQPPKTEEQAFFESFNVYYFHTPYFSEGAAEQLMKALEEY